MHMQEARDKCLGLKMNGVLSKAEKQDRGRF